MIEIIAIAAAAVLAGFTQGLTGFGSVLVVLPAFTVLAGVKTAVPLANLFGFWLSLYLCIQLRSIRHWAIIWPLIAAALPGIVLGTWILTVVSARCLELALAGTLGFFCLYSVFGKTCARESENHGAMRPDYHRVCSAGASERSGLPW